MAERWLDYEDAGRLFGISAEAMRKRVRRLGWTIRQPNEPGAKAMVLVPDGAEVRPPKRGRSPLGHRSDVLMDELRRRAESAEAQAATLRQQFENALGRAERAEGEAQALQEAVMHERAQVAAAQAERQVAQAERNSLEAELEAWTAGGPVARAWRAFLTRRARRGQ
jgi:cell division protein FtsB